MKRKRFSEEQIIEILKLHSAPVVVAPGADELPAAQAA
jgi:hypothetical protein